METLGEPALAFLPFPMNDGANYCWNGNDHTTVNCVERLHNADAQAISCRSYDENNGDVLSTKHGSSAFCQAPDNGGAYNVRSPSEDVGSVPYGIYQDVHGCDTSPEMRSLTHDFELSRNTCGGGLGELGLLTNNEMPCMCPPPPMTPRLDAPSSFDVMEFSYPNYQCHHSSRGGPLNSSQNFLQSSMVNYMYQNGSGPNKRLKNTYNLPLRSSSPVFPEQSTPLRNVPLLSSKNCISTSSEKFKIVSAASIDSAAPDPQPNCNPNNTSPLVFPTNFGTSGFTFTSTNSMSDLTPTKHFVELDIPSKYAKKISELDKKIMKLQAERSIILEKVSQTKECRTNFSSFDHCEDSFLWKDKATELAMASVKIYICSVGIKELDEPLYDEGNTLLRRLGGLHLDLQAALDMLKRICFKNSSYLGGIAECFSHIKGLLSEGQTLSLLNSDGICTIQLEQLENESNTESAQGFRLKEALESVNRALHCAQFITLSHSGILADLGMAKEAAKDKIAILNKVILQNGLADREKMTISTILEGNYITMTSAERVWSQYYRMASETISMVTEILHPSQSP